MGRGEPNGDRKAGDDPVLVPLVTVGHELIQFRYRGELRLRGKLAAAAEPDILYLDPAVPEDAIDPGRAEEDE